MSVDMMGETIRAATYLVKPKRMQTLVFSAVLGVPAGVYFTYCLPSSGGGFEHHSRALLHQRGRTEQAATTESAAVPTALKITE